MQVTTDTLKHFQPISLKDMDSVSLMNRVDIKYVLSIKQLSNVLRAVSSSYFIMEELGIRNFLYRNIYFDTEDKQLFLSHHNGRSLRHKLRIREYSVFNRFFLEIKKKFKGRTMKSRLLLSENGSIEQFENLNDIPAEFRDFIEQKMPYTVDILQESLKNEFMRITLVHKDMQERITIDTDLCFRTPDSREGALPAVAVVEIKKSGHSGTHSFQAELKRLGIRPGSMSKYCIGSISLFPDLKYNNFKRTNLTIERLAHAGI